MGDLRLCATLFVFVGFVGVAEAQQGTSAIRGRVLDEQNAVLPGVTLVVTHQQTGIFRNTVTGEDGAYSVTDLVPGPYRVSAELAGFKKLTLENIILTGGLTQTQNLVLQIGALEESVSVSSQAPQVDVTSAVVGANVSKIEVEALPAFTTNATAYLQTVPGVVYFPSAKVGGEGFTVNGQTSGNTANVDGGNNSIRIFACCAYRTLVPTDVVQEIVAITSQVPAEYGGRTGAVINTITKQGTNLFHGGFHSLYEAASFVAPNYLNVLNNLPKQPASQWQAGFTIGGPIVRNKVFFFFALEDGSLGTTNSSVFPSNPAKNFTSVSDIFGWNTFARVDHQIDANNMYAVRYLGRNQSCVNNITCRAGNAPGIPTFTPTTLALADESEYDSFVAANYNHVFSDRKLNVLTFSSPEQRIQTSPPGNTSQTECVTCLAATLRYLSFDDQASLFSHYRSDPQFTIEDAFSWFVPGGKGHGSHDLKFGGQYNYLGQNLTLKDAQNGYFTFATNTPFDSTKPATYPELLTIRTEPETSHEVVHSVAAYARDNWQWTNNLTVDLGLRYDLFIAPTPNQFNPLSADRKSYPIDWRDVGPRLGFAYSSSDKKAVLRGGYGVLYQSPWMNGFFDNLYDNSVYGTGVLLNFPSSGVPDPGPNAGHLPTDPLLVNGPVVNRALLNQLVPPGALDRNTNTVYLDDPNRVSPRFQEASVGYEREFSKNVSVRADYIRNRGSRIIVPYDLNPGLRASTSRTAPITRFDLQGIANQLGISPFSSSVFLYQSVGEEHYDGLSLALNRRFANFWGARASYTLSRCTNDTDAGNNYQVLGDRNLTWGPCTNGRTHIFSVSGQVVVPRTGGLQVSGALRALSGLPLTIFNSGVDTDRNGILIDPLPAATYSGNGAGAFTVKSDGGFNGAVGPGFAELDLRVGYRFRSGRGSSVEVSGDVFNVTNEPNFSNPTSDQRNPLFLLPTALVGGGLPRQFQLHARFSF
jgi:hypothetical protein